MNSQFKRLIIIALALLSYTAASAQANFRVEWSRVKMDSTWEAATHNNPNLKAGEVIAKYKPGVDALGTVIGRAAKDLPKHAPQSELSNFAADALREFATNWMAENKIDGIADMAVTNFGGMRVSNFPKGDITIAMVMQCFPFDNRVVIVDMQGKYIRQMMQNFARRGRIEVVSGIELHIKDKKVEKFLIGGKKLDDNKIYKVATIDFLAAGGDGLYSFKNASQSFNTNIQIKDVIINKIKSITAEGKELDPKVDGRVKLEK